MTVRTDIDLFVQADEEPEKATPEVQEEAKQAEAPKVEPTLISFM